MSGADRPRRRAWLAALAAALLLGVWQVADFTYVSLRTEPPRYVATRPGAVVEGRFGTLRLLSWQQTSSWGHGYYSDRAAAPEPGTAWVVAQLELTLRSSDDDLDCAFTLVASDGRRWSAVLVTAAEVEGESCVPDDHQVGRTYAFHQGFQVPLDALDQLAGVAEDRFTLDRIPLMVPPG